MNGAAEEKLASAEKLLEMRRLNQALRTFEEAEAMGAAGERCAAGRWQVHMLRGDFPAAWAESSAIRAGATTDDPNCLWRGEDIRGKNVIVRCLHGFGDAVQFFRYAPRLNAMAKKVVWEVPPELVQLVQYFPGVEHVVTWGDHRRNEDQFVAALAEGAAAQDWEVQIEVMELPCIFQTSVADLPIATDYLQLPPKLADSVHAGMGAAAMPRVGLVWSAGEWNPSRSIPVELLPQILEVNGCEFWNLQGGADRHSASFYKLHETKLCNSGILALATVVSQLDLVITVDTLAAHLAGALGVEAWVLLQHSADWRWMVDRDDSPWYPSLRLFRQPSPGNWAAVLHAVRYELREWLESEAEGEAA